MLAQCITFISSLLGQILNIILPFGFTFGSMVFGALFCLWLVPAIMRFFN